MGIYLDPGSDNFEISRSSQIYIDKSELIAYLNQIAGTEQRYVCVSRPRRFGKSMAANMISAYYQSGIDTIHLFSDLKIANDPSFKKHLNQYHVVFLNMQDFFSRTHCVDDVMTLLIHLGYLAFDEQKSEGFIPNYEVSKEFVNAVDGAGWNDVIKTIQSSEQLLEATWANDSESVAKYLELAHMDTSILTYNDENALAYTTSLAYFSARTYYTIIRELPTGKGFSDLVFLPRKNHLDKPALLVELKWDKTVTSALSQIKEKHYVHALDDYSGNILLVGINYDKQSKTHECIIERFTK